MVFNLNLSIFAFLMLKFAWNISIRISFNNIFMFYQRKKILIKIESFENTMSKLSLLTTYIRYNMYKNVHYRCHIENGKENKKTIV